MDKTVQKFSSLEEADEADYAYYRERRQLVHVVGKATV